MVNAILYATNKNRATHNAIAMQRSILLVSLSMIYLFYHAFCHHKNGKRHRKKCDKGLDLHADRRLYVWMWVIIGQLKILVLEVEDALY